MKDFFQVLRQKVLDIERVRKEIEALHCLRPHLHFRCFLHPAASVPGSDVEALEQVADQLVFVARGCRRAGHGSGWRRRPWCYSDGDESGNCASQKR